MIRKWEKEKKINCKDNLMFQWKCLDSESTSVAKGMVNGVNCGTMIPKSHQNIVSDWPGQGVF